MFELLLLALVPLIGIIVRYRATYHPKIKDAKVTKSAVIGLPPTPITTTVCGEKETDSKDRTDFEVVLDVQKDAEVHVEDTSNTEPAPEPTPAPSFIGVWRSVWREEKIEGLFKGIFPGFPFSWFFLRGFVSPAPTTFLRDYITVLPVNVLYIPYMVFTYRVIVSPHKLRLWEPKKMYRLLFSDYERQHPFKAYRYSTLVIPYIAAILFDFFLVCAVRDLIGDVNSPVADFEVTVDGTGVWMDGVHSVLTHILWREVARIAAYPLFAVVCAIIMTPVDVIITRLAIQPIHGKPQSEPMEERDIEKMADTTIEPSYLKLTTEQRPYAGFVDCFKRIVDEEGWGVLYRSWFFTFLGYFIPFLR